MADTADDVKRVAIIGAGLSGLLSLYHLKTSRTKIELTAFEKNFDIGGIWLYTDQTKPNDFGLPVYTGLYKYLRTNLPLPLMTIPGFECDETLPSYPGKEDVFNYLQSFCHKADLRQYIKFNTLVEDVKQVDKRSRQTKWSVTYRDIRTKETNRTEKFDYVIVCNGNCVLPRMPVVKGSDKFKGYITHSMYYRNPEIYTGQTVAILGGKFSATDIGVQLTKYATKVYMCNRGPEFPAPLPSNMEQKLSGFDHMTANSIVLESGEEITVDSVIYCTGYQYDFPFLPNGIVKVEDNKIRNLYKEIIPVEYNTIMFMSLPREVAFFAITSQQACFIKSLIEGSTQLPDVQEMKLTIDHDFDQGGVNVFSQWEYDKELAALGQFEPLPKVLKKLANCCFEQYMTNFQNLRSLMFKVTGPNSFTVKSVL